MLYGDDSNPGAIRVHIGCKQYTGYTLLTPLFPLNIQSILRNYSHFFTHGWSSRNILVRTSGARDKFPVFRHLSCDQRPDTTRWWRIEGPVLPLSRRSCAARVGASVNKFQYLDGARTSIHHTRKIGDGVYAPKDLQDRNLFSEECWCYNANYIFL